LEAAALAEDAVAVTGGAQADGPVRTAGRDGRCRWHRAGEGPRAAAERARHHQVVVHADIAAEMSRQAAEAAAEDAGAAVTVAFPAGASGAEAADPGTTAADPTDAIAGGALAMDPVAGVTDAIHAVSPVAARGTHRGRAKHVTDKDAMCKCWAKFTGQGGPAAQLQQRAGPHTRRCHHQALLQHPPAAAPARAAARLCPGLFCCARSPGALVCEFLLQAGIGPL